jgi:lysophospholipase L1-like esterase
LLLAASPDVARAQSGMITASARAATSLAPAVVSVAIGSRAALAEDEVAPVPVARDDVLNNAQCRAPSTVFRLGGTLNRLARRLAAHEPVVIVAVGSSSTGGAGASSPAFAYPHRLADELRKHFPDGRITMINRGVNGETAPEMVARLDRTVLSEKPDLVLWQVGTNSVVRDEKIPPLYQVMRNGVKRIKESGAELVLINPQYAPRVLERSACAAEMNSLVDRIAAEEHVSVFHRFEVMRHWREDRRLSFETFMTGDGLHLNDWGYACWAHLLGEAIAGSVKRAQSIARVNFAVDAAPVE